LSATEIFVAHRNLLFTVAYEMLGSAADAEDVLQETWLRRKPAAVRQIAHRARGHVAARRPRQVVSPAETRDALGAFQRAVETGDLQCLLDILAPDVVLLTDGGGVVQAVLEPVVGADRVAGFLSRITPAVSLRPAEINGYPALIVTFEDELSAVLAIQLENGRITGLYAVRNPEKLSRLDAESHGRRLVCH
jgi:RNA polymerase sigma-70 factor (ECF subfamily)